MQDLHVVETWVTNSFPFFALNFRHSGEQYFSVSFYSIRMVIDKNMQVKKDKGEEIERLLSTPVSQLCIHPVPSEMYYY